MLFDKDNKGRTLQGESMLWFNCFCFNKSWSDTVVGNHSAVTGCTVLLTVCVQIFYLFLCCSELKHLSFYSVIPCTWLVKKKHCQFHVLECQNNAVNVDKQVWKTLSATLQGGKRATGVQASRLGFGFSHLLLVKCHEIDWDCITEPVQVWAIWKGIKKNQKAKNHSWHLIKVKKCSSIHFFFFGKCNYCNFICEA